METQSAFMGAAGALVLLLAVLVRRREPAALVLAALTASFAAWCLARGLATLGVAAPPAVTAVSLASAGSLTVGLALALTGTAPSWRRLGPGLAAGPLLVVAIASQTGGHDRTLEIFSSAWAFAGSLAGAVLLTRRPPSSEQTSPAEITRLGYVSIAHWGIVAGALIDAARALFSGVPVVSLLSPLFYIYAVYLHVSQVRVADLRQLLSKTVALTCMAAGLAGFFAAIRIWVGEELDLFVFNAFVASFALMLFFEPAHARIQAVMDRRFIAEKLALERALEPLGAELTHVRTLDELLPALLGSFEHTDRVRSASIFLRDDAQVGFQQAGAMGLSPRTRVSLIRHPAWVDALEANSALVYEDLERARTSARDEDERGRLDVLCRTMSDLDTDLVLPLRTERQLVGFWTLTGREPEEPFSTDEVRLLVELAERLAVSIENSKTFERIRARDRFASLGEMAAGLAHEIRNPLGTIRGALAVIDEGGEDSDALNEVIVEEIERLNRLVESFLDYARPATQAHRIDDVGSFARQCARAMTRNPLGASTPIEVHVQEALPPVTADAVQLERVVVNAIQNAQEALEGTGNITVSVTCEFDGEQLGPYVEIIVEDDGPGMDTETLDRAFVPFFTTKMSGYGLGLALSERLMRAQNGAIQLESEPGHGTRVRIQVPRCESCEAEAS